MVMTPMKAIRKKCLDCMGNRYKTVRLCEDKECPLHPYRMGRRPKDRYSSKQKTNIVRATTAMIGGMLV
jgi:hypothetical protein